MDQWREGEAEEDGKKAGWWEEPSCANLWLKTICRKPPAIQETGVKSLGREDPLEVDTAIHPSSFAWRIPWTEETSGLQLIGSQNP